MNSTDYFKNVKRTESPSISTVNNRILHGAIGIGTEAGKVLDAVKKSMFYGRALNTENILEELGDLLWYMGLIAGEIGVTFEQLMDRNIAKLRARYPEQFTQADDVGRDYQKEAEAVNRLPNPVIEQKLNEIEQVTVNVEKSIEAVLVCPLPIKDERNPVV